MTYVVGDIHGKLDYVKEIINLAGEESILWIGDWMDSFDRSVNDQMSSLEIALERDQDIFILGNHDNHYITQIGIGSGYKDDTQYKVDRLLTNNLNRFRIAHYDGVHLFSHGGITKTFINRFVEKHNNIEFSVKTLNESFFDTSTWNKSNPLFWISGHRGGLDPCSGPLWCDTRELQEDISTNGSYNNAIQIVGHSAHACSKTKSIIGSDKGYIYCVDVLDFAKQILKINIDNSLEIVNF